MAILEFRSGEGSASASSSTSRGARRLEADELCRRCDVQTLDFDTTDALEPLPEPLGQSRALEAVRFGIGIRHEGYNLFAMGPEGAGKHTALRAVLEAQTAKEPVPDDFCYVHDFGKPQAPRVLRLPPGKGRELERDVTRLVGELKIAIPAALETDEFRAKKGAIEEEHKEAHERSMRELREMAERQSVALVQTPMGFAFLPLRDGVPVKPDDFGELPEEVQARFEKDVEALGEALRERLSQLPRLEQDLRRRMRALAKETILAAVGHLLDDVRRQYEAFPKVGEHLAALGHDVVENVGLFLKSEDGPLAPAAIFGDGDSPLRRYQVNVLVENADLKGAPVVYEDHPSYDNLVGRVEHRAQLGALVTDFSLIRAGALHRANGGYLLLDVRRLVQQPYAWDGLKRALSGRQVRIQSLGQLLGIASTATLEAEPMPLDVKVVLLGERQLFYLLEQLDPEFHALFKVAVDFEDVVDRSPENDRLYARLVATLVKREKLLPFDRTGVARVIEHGARMADDSERLTAHVGVLTDLLREADHWAREGKSAVVGDAHVEQAIRAEERRVGRIRERMLEEFQRGTVLLDTRGAKVGQVNGASVLQLGRSSFGRPARITARVRLGRGEVVDIEREVELSGPIHSKGVLILSAFLGARYAPEHPLSLAASLTFEQSYGPVEGDSASCAELYALLSALAEVPIKQCFAVTGSVNQHGEVQAVGGVNEKIEGFFDVCHARDPAGEYGFLLPAANVKHLMLRHDVVEAARAGTFHLWAVSTIDEGMEILTGLPAGARDARGTFPQGSINRRAEDRLLELATTRLALGLGLSPEPRIARGADASLDKA
jgi:lon-related putative ATP-dependent protease